jgi:hypothetical protein
MAFILLLIFGLPLAGMIYGYFMERLKSQERMKAMEKGIPISAQGSMLKNQFDLDPMQAWSARKTPWERADDLRLAGLICIAVGVGLALLLWTLARSIEDVQKGVFVVGAIPGLIGVVLLYESNRRLGHLGPRPTQAPQSPTKD